MRYGFVLPSGDARTAATLAREAEQAGWDAFFVWEPVWGVDAWVCLTAAAMRTETIKLGTLLSPLSRMRPWKMASETATLDNLSGGRVILAVGLGAINSGFVHFGEETDRKIRAELLDESLDIITGLWQGQPFEYHGKHYTVLPTDFQPPAPPVQQPRIPIWVVGGYPSQKSMGRAMKYDGLLPNYLRLKEDGQHTEEPRPVHLKEITDYVRTHRTASTPYDIITEGTTPGDDPAKAAAIVQEWADVGATWWIESMWTANSHDEVVSRLRQGPPRIES